MFPELRVSCLLLELVCILMNPSIERQRRVRQRERKRGRETSLCSSRKSRAMNLGRIHVQNKEQSYYRVAKTHNIPYLYRSFSAKVTYI